MDAWLTEDPRFKKGVAIVTGGSGAIGGEICLALARAGSNVVLTYGSNKAAAESVAQQIEELGRKAEIAQLRIENAADVADFAAAVAERHGGIHSVVYASGPSLHMEFIGDIQPDDWARVISVDVMGCFNLVHATLPHLRAGGGGAYLAVITAAVERVPARDIQSAAPKAAIEMLMRGVAKEEGRHGIRANCVGPGWIAAGLGKQVMDTELTPAMVDNIVKATPLRRMGQAGEVADAALFLLSSKAGFITGQSLAVDGGAQV